MTNYRFNNLNTKVRKVLQDAWDLSGFFHSVTDSGTQLRNVVKFSDLNIYLENENLQFITADGDNALERPSMVIYNNYSGGSIPVNGVLAVEFQIMVNNNDMISLDAYTTLCRLLCNSKQEERRWYRRGLLPKRNERTGELEYQEFEIQDGSQIYPDLKNKVLLRSIQCNFNIVGDLYHD